jgi:HAD superfamily hydrolase (TIGR01490 family)
MNRPLVIFDLDGTITRGDTFRAFLWYALSRRPQRLLNCLGLPAKLVQFTCGQIPREEIKYAFLKAIVGSCCREDIERLAATFIRRRFPKMAKRTAVLRVQWHRRRRHLLFLATGSLDLYAVAAGNLLGFDRVIATRTSWDGDRIARGFEGGNLRGETKLAEVKRALALLDEQPSRIIVYSDHHSDLPLLHFADEAIAVDPTPRFGRMARLYGFSVENWADPTSVPHLGREDPAYCPVPSKE